MIREMRDILSNEVAITCDIGADNPLEVYGVSFGSEHEVDVRADTLSNHILVRRNPWQ